MKKTVLAAAATVLFAVSIQAAAAGERHGAGRSEDAAAIRAGTEALLLHNDIIRKTRSDAPMYKPGDMEGRQATAVDPATIRVMVNYTQAAMAAQPNLENLVREAVAETNEGYAASGVFVRLELAHISQIDLVETDPATAEGLHADVEAYMHPTDGRVDEIHALRDQHKADIAAIVLDTKAAGGVAPYVGSDASTAFIGISAHMPLLGIALAHEIGHLQGATHNPESGGESSAMYAFGLGYLNEVAGWCTVMGYESEKARWIHRWANPDLMYSGVPGGTQGMHDTRRVLNLTSHYIAGYR